MIDYPKKLDIIFDKLNEEGATPIIVGGFVRDALLGLESKDIDIEVYNLASYEKLKNILKNFGSVNLVGKSFGICKVGIDDLDLDFSLPRKDNKISSGHKGFEIEVDSSLNFYEASKRRDFTINAIGYDPAAKKIIDPFSGQKDIKDKILRAVDPTKFAQDPLRVLRGVVFCARFGFEMDGELKNLCSQMIQNQMLDELPSQRIFEEIKKILTKAKKPSIGFRLLKELSDGKLLNLKKDTFDEFLKLTDTIPSLTLTQKQLNKLTNIILTTINDSSCQTDPLKKELTKITNPPPLLQGRDLIELGLTPSKKFSTILEKAYMAQINGEFNNITDAKKYLKKLLS
jgi:tRNA nucleotidyltransferase (CCA-adding enzyme)